MKKLAFIAIVAFSCTFVSCKKDRTCTCTYTKTGSSSTETQITTYDDVKKKAAQANCTSGTSYDPADASQVEVRTCSLD
ncbi:MAG: hypothetical protein M3R27_09535 [Bacteroidota bacterium]|nr:hypothetical protein [Bacteroidota bacterium]